MSDMKLAIQILADARGAVGELETMRQEIGRLATSGRATADELKPLNDRIGDLERGLDGARRAGMAVRGVLGALGVGFSVRAVLQATIEQERVLAQLDARIRSTGGAAGLTRRELEDMANEMQRVTTFSNEAVNGMQAVLLTFTQVRGDVFRDATPLILDMATAMGMDLQSAALQVGKALNDPLLGVSALSRAGVQFNEEQREMIKLMVETGDVAGAQRIILEELEKQFGGSARAARETFGGALIGLREAISDLMKSENGEGLEDARQSIERLTAFIQQPSTVRSFNTFADAIIRSFSIAIEGMTEFVRLGELVGETAARMTGAQIAELDRLDKAIEDLEARLGSTWAKRLRFFGRDLEGNFELFAMPDDAAIEAGLETLRKQREELLKEAGFITQGEKDNADDRKNIRTEDTKNLGNTLGAQQNLYKEHNKELAKAQSERARLERSATQLESDFEYQLPVINKELQNILELYRALPEAQRALKRGDFDEAARGAEALAQQLQQARREGQLSVPEMRKFSREIAAIMREAGRGGEAQAEGVPLEIDENSLETAVKEGRAWIQWAMEDEPPKVPLAVEVERQSVLDDLEIPEIEQQVTLPATLDTAPAAEEFRQLAERLRAEVIRISVQLDVSDGPSGQVAEDFAREAMKRGAL